MKLINKAKEYAEQFHKEHKRISGESYIDHIEKTVLNLLQNNIDDEIILGAAYLKNVLSMDEKKESELRKEFTDEIVDILLSYKKVSENYVRDIEAKDVDDTFILQAYLGLMTDYRVLLIRLSTKVADSQTLISLPREQAVRIAQRSLHIYAPIARIVSMRNFAVQLENNAFKILYPEIYVKIEKKVKGLENTSNEFLSKTIPVIVQLLKENSINVIDIKTRLKHIYGVFRKERYYKYKGKSVGKNYDGIKDILGLRIILETVDDCYKAEDILKQLWEYIEEERDDYITRPRVSGYKAIHNVFKTDNLTFETQILTKDMYEFNEFGPAKHSVYKIMDAQKGSTKNDRIKVYLKDYLKSVEKVSSHEPIIKTSNKIYTFTPKGAIIELQKGSVLIDFAYAIHAEVGNSAVGGVVNGKNKKLTDELFQGDKVEIKTLSSKKYPSEDWIKYVKISKARTLIRKALRHKKKIEK